MWSNIEDPVKGEPFSLHRIKEEIIDLFASNPFLLASEGWLASLLCRPVRLVEAAVRELESEGVLARGDRHFLLGLVEGSLAHSGKEQV